jgi:hypothetical protein
MSFFTSTAFLGLYVALSKCPTSVGYEKYEQLCPDRVAYNFIDKEPNFGDCDLYRLDHTNVPWSYALPAIPQRKGRIEA